MLQNPDRDEETERMTNTLDKLLLDAIKGLVYEPHEEHVEYEGEMDYDMGGQRQSSDDSGGRSVLPMLLVGAALAAVGYVLGKRSGSGGRMGGGASSSIEDATDMAAERTQEMAETTADTIREGGQQLSERTEEKAGRASERIEETSEEFGDQLEEGGSEAADEMEDSG